MEVRNNDIMKDFSTLLWSVGPYTHTPKGGGHVHTQQLRADYNKKRNGELVS